MGTAKMKYKFHFILVTTSLVILFAQISFAQSPYLTFKAEINGDKDFILQLNMWDLSQRYDTSYLKDKNKINVADSNLVFALIDTGKSFELGNQWFTTDRVFAFWIIKENEITTDTMVVIFVVEEYSWVTNIDLGKLDFKPGYFEVPIDYTKSKENNYTSFLTINKNYNWQITSEEERRILFTKEK